MLKHSSTLKHSGMLVALVVMGLILSRPAFSGVPDGFFGPMYYAYAAAWSNGEADGATYSQRPLSSTLSIDMSSKVALSDCPDFAWVGKVSFIHSQMQVVEYWGTGNGCWPYGIGYIKYADGTSYFGQSLSYYARRIDDLKRNEIQQALMQPNNRRVGIKSGFGIFLSADNQPIQVGYFKNDELTKDLSADTHFLSMLKAARDSFGKQSTFAYTPAVMSMISYALTLKCQSGNCIDQPSVAVYENGDRYEGDWKDFRPRGQGRIQYANGDRFDGEVRNGFPFKGKFAYADGSRYEGEFVGIFKSGWGSLYRKDGKLSYQGQWGWDKPHGEGQLYWDNGGRYKGQFKQGRLNGEGTLYEPDGTEKLGFFKDGKLSQLIDCKGPGCAQSYAKDSTPPVITLSRGVNITSRAQHSIKGNAKDASGVAIVTVNGQDAALDAEGNFSAGVLLVPGDNNIQIVAIDRFNNRAVKTITLSRDAKLASIPPVLTTPGAIQIGKYHALIIGVEAYLNDAVTDLSEPIADARRLKSILASNYTFEAENIKLLENPTRNQILDQLDQLVKRLGESDNLLIFYAGHGYWDERTNQGYWLPSDASQDRRSGWISNSTIVDYVNGIKAKHTLLVADACFSGGIFKTRSAFSNAPAATGALYELPSRKAMTSGTLSEVPDKSVFVEYLTKHLQQNRDPYVSSEELFSRFRTAVINNSPVNQVPQFGEIRQTGDEGGDFIFVKRNNKELLPK